MNALQHATTRPRLEAGTRVRISHCLAEVLISTEGSKVFRFVQEGPPGQGGAGVIASEAAKSAFERPDLGSWLGRFTVSLSDEEIRRRCEDGTFIVVSPPLPGANAVVTAVAAVMASRVDASNKRALLRKVVIDVLQNLIAGRASAGTRSLIPVGMTRIFDLAGGTHLDRGTGKRTARR